MDSKTIKHIVSLARMNLGEREEEKMQKELSSVLDYIEHLNKVNTDNIEPLYQTTGLANSMRDDDHRRDFEINESLNEKLIGQAPDKDKGFVRVKSILNK